MCYGKKTSLVARAKKDIGFCNKQAEKEQSFTSLPCQGQRKFVDRDDWETSHAIQSKWKLNRLTVLWLQTYSYKNTWSAPTVTTSFLLLTSEHSCRKFNLEWHFGSIECTLIQIQHSISLLQDIKLYFVFRQKKSSDRCLTYYPQQKQITGVKQQGLVAYYLKI